MAPAPPSAAFSQGLTLARRSLSILSADKQNLALLAAQPLLIAGLICVVCNELPQILFLLVIAGLWFGCSNAAQQIVKERAVYRRERMVNLRLDGYVLSKFLPLAGICLGQCWLMLGMVWVFRGGEGNLLLQAVAVLLAAWNGVALGLIVSALASSPDKALFAVPLTLLPQIILAGVLVALPSMNLPTRLASYLAVSRWANQAIEAALLEGRTIDQDLLTDAAYVRPLENLYPDEELRKPEGRLRFLNDPGNTRVDKPDVAISGYGVMLSFLLVQLAAVAVVLRRQDPF